MGRLDFDGPINLTNKGDLMTFFSFLFRLLVASLMGLAAGPSMATLGQAPSRSAASIAPPPVSGARLMAVTPAAASSLYTVHQVQLDSGTLVTEFASPAGVVFALTWQGPVLPDLSALLGDYFKTFKAQTERSRLVGQRNASVSMALDGLVVQSSGRMRHFFGSAYAPDLIPTGVHIHELLQ